MSPEAPKSGKYQSEIWRGNLPKRFLNNHDGSCTKQEVQAIPRMWTICGLQTNYNVSAITTWRRERVCHRVSFTMLKVMGGLPIFHTGAETTLDVHGISLHGSWFGQSFGEWPCKASTTSYQTLHELGIHRVSRDLFTFRSLVQRPIFNITFHGNCRFLRDTNISN